MSKGKLAKSHTAKVLRVFWTSPSGRMTLDEVTEATGLPSADALTVFRECGPVFRHESISGSGVWRCLLTPPSVLRQSAQDGHSTPVITTS
jgi:hypothetical protein